MKPLVSLMVVVLLFRTALASPRAPFVFVMIDSQTEALYGTLPFNRAIIAKAVDRLTAARAKAIVIKFFYDLPSTEANDGLLEASICKSHIALQASLNDDEGTTNFLEAKFTMDATPKPAIPDLFTGGKAMLPLRRFSRCAEAVGFVDVGLEDQKAADIPLLEMYQGKMVKSLFLVSLELATDQKAKIESSGTIRFAGKSIPLLHRIDFQSQNSFQYIPLHEVVNDNLHNWEKKVEHAVVILGYVGSNIHSIQTPIGPLSAHQLFIAGLMSLSRSTGNDE